jgi:hypothetical protein
MKTCNFVACAVALVAMSEAGAWADTMSTQPAGGGSQTQNMTTQPAKGPGNWTMLAPTRITPITVAPMNNNAAAPVLPVTIMPNKMSAQPVTVHPNSTGQPSVKVTPLSAQPTHNQTQPVTVMPTMQQPQQVQPNLPATPLPGHPEFVPLAAPHPGPLQTAAQNTPTAHPHKGGLGQKHLPHVDDAHQPWIIARNARIKAAMEGRGGAAPHQPVAPNVPPDFRPDARPPLRAGAAHSFED